MANLNHSQSASPPARKPNKTGKLELVSAHPLHRVLPNDPSQSTTQCLSLSFTLLSLPLFLQALYTKYLSPHLLPISSLRTQNDHDTPINPSSPSLLDACRTHSYTTQIVSLDPLMLYINNFTSAAEAEALIQLGSPDFEDSFISRAGGGTQKASGRTSQSAPLAMEEPLVGCGEYIRCSGGRGESKGRC
jgi:prolyl 4-hydroxylase